MVLIFGWLLMGTAAFLVVYLSTVLVGMRLEAMTNWLKDSGWYALAAMLIAGVGLYFTSRIISQVI